MVYPVGNAAYPTAAEIRDQILRDLAYYGARNGLTYNTKPGSDYYLLATSVANRVAIAIANNQISNDQRNPLLATGDALREIARVYGIEERPASISAGQATVKVSASTTIPSGWRATAPNGKKYDVASTATVSNGGIVTIVSVDRGAGTVLAAGAQLTWDSAAIATLLNPLTVGAGGIVGGIDADTDEVIRDRLVDRLSAQAIGGNAASIKQWAEEPSAAVEKAYVYQATRGPGSLDFAITRAAGDRVLPSEIVIESRASVAAQMPGGVVSIVGTSVVAEPLDVLVLLELPTPLSAGGTGGGWRDSTPWPPTLTKVTGVAGSTLTVDATVSPVVGKSIGLWDRTPTTPVMRELRILTVGGSSGAYTITCVESVSFVQTGDLVSAGAVNLVGYAETARAALAALGPGEKTDNVDLLPRSYRFPPPTLDAPYEITSRQITAIQAAYPEISDIAYGALYETGTTTTRTSPSLPPTTADAPRILTLQNLAFVPKP